MKKYIVRNLETAELSYGKTLHDVARIIGMLHDKNIISRIRWHKLFAEPLNGYIIGNEKVEAPREVRPRTKGGSVDVNTDNLNKGYIGPYSK